MENNKKQNDEKTVLTIVIGFLIVFTVFQLKWALNTAIVVGLVGVFSSYLSSLISKLWFKISWVLGLIVPNILLGAVFYVILTPLALISSIGKNKLFLKKDMQSTFENCESEFTEKYFTNTW